MGSLPQRILSNSLRSGKITGKTLFLPIRHHGLPDLCTSFRYDGVNSLLSQNRELRIRSGISRSRYGVSLPAMKNPASGAIPIDLRCDWNTTPLSHMAGSILQDKSYSCIIKFLRCPEDIGAWGKRQVAGRSKKLDFGILIVDADRSTFEAEGGVSI